ncbi:DEAD/DEAH box helicase [Desertimonas flava]|uniref:DEAD/DEAH box helicase n=1 Tax=Desertimonas flava TaxID=2064846 RepID=UPI0013C4355E|nr:DEAD/DEAH box helicase [Desertimonas flava]
MDARAELKRYLHAAIGRVAANCDGAREQDGIGFDGSDSKPGRMIASCPPETWSDQMASQAGLWCRKYARQIGPDANGLADEAAKTFGTVTAKSADVKAITAAEGGFIVRFGYNPDVSDALREMVVGARWNGDKRAWIVPRQQGVRLESFAARYGFTLSNAAHALLTASRHMQTADGKVGFDGTDVTIAFADVPDAAVRKAVKALPGCRFDSVAKLWRLPPRYVRTVRDLAARFEWATTGDFDALPDLDPDVVDVKVRADGTTLLVSFPYDKQLIDIMNQVGARWDGRAEVKAWRIPAEAGFDLLSVLEHQKVKVADDDSTGDLLDQARQMLARITNSRALDADFEVSGMACDLYPFQRAGVKYVVEAGGRSLIGDEMGLGKTPQGLAALQAMNAWPAAVLVPNVVKVNWVRAAHKFFPHLRVVALYGMLKPEFARQLVRMIEVGQPDGLLVPYTMSPGEARSIKVTDRASAVEAYTLLTQADLIVVNYDVLGPTELTEKETLVGKRPDPGWVPVLKALPLKGIVADESHGLKDPKTLRTRACIETARSLPDGAAKIGMSGTLVLNRRVEVAAQLDFIGMLDEFGGYTAVKQMPDLARRLRARCMVRRDKAEVLPELPPRQHEPIVLNQSELDAKVMAEYRHAERDLLDFLARRAAEMALEAGLDPTSAAIEARMKAAGAEFLIRIGVLLRLALRAKKKAARRWIDEFAKTGEKLLVFGSHLEQLDEFAAEFGAPEIKGGVSPERRMEIVDDFQDPNGAQLCFLQIHAGGVGLTMTAASNVLFLEQAWSPMLHDQAIDRCYGRLDGDPHGAVGWYLVAEDTIEEWVSQLLAEKRIECADALDGDVTDGQIESTSVYSDLVGMLVRKAVQP